MNQFLKLMTFAVPVLFMSRASAQFFLNPKEPFAPGHRQARVTIDLKGVAVSQFRSSIVYGTDSLAVKNAFDINKRDPSKYYETPATLKDIGDGKAEATVIFPHSGNPANNRGKVFPKGTKIFYAWTRTNRPAGFTEDLTLNSPVYSFIMPRPLTIAYLGDSYASGEGAKGNGPWMHEPCHRSANSGGELAIRKLKQEKKEIEVDYINTTCSGARLLDYFAEAQKVEPGKTAVKQGIQVDLVVNWLDSKNYDGIDILLAGGGGNDIGFGNIVSGGLLSFFQDLTDDEELKKDVQRELNRLPETFTLFKNYVESKTTVGQYIWFNYPNPITGNPLPGGGYDANLCKQNLLRAANPLDCWGILENNIENNEWKYVYDHVFLKLNQKVAEGVGQHGWSLTDVSERSLRKGICNCEGYFNTVGQSMLNQGDVYGTVHPNITGFREIYRDPLYSQLNTSLLKFYKDYLADAKERAKEAAKAKAKAKLALQNNSSKLSVLVSEQNKLLLDLKNKLKPVDTKQLKTIKQ
jgi:hypothetical protein